MEREQTAKAQLKLRLPEPLRAALEAAAAARGVSMNTEAVARLQQTFSEDQAFGGAEMRRLVYLMAANFSTGARGRAGGRPGWVDDPDGYRAGMMAVVNALLLGLPDAAEREMLLELEGVKGRVLSHFAQRRAEQAARKDAAGRRPAA